MAANGGQDSKAKFYQEDIVRRHDDPHAFGVVLRCWHDEEYIPPSNNSADDPLLRPLNKDEIGISLFPGNERMIVNSSDYVLVDRFFDPGSLCKRNIDDMQSGVVVGVDVKFKVQQVISGAVVDDWKSYKDVEYASCVSIGDYVMYNDWMGQVQEMYDESTFETQEKTLVRVPYLSVRLSVGDRSNDSSMMEALYGIEIPISTSGSETVVAIKHTVLAIAWMAINQSLSPAEAAQKPRPQRFWHGADVYKLVIFRGLSEQFVHVGDKFVLRDAPQGYVTEHGSACEKVEVSTFVVCETKALVNVLWQDGKEEVLPSTELVPYLNRDEYDCWPGDHIIWKTEGKEHVGVVQSVSASDRTASLLLYDGKTQYVSMLELDARSDYMDSPQSFGVRRGDYVFVHPEGSTNGCQAPIVPRIGELEPWVRELPFLDEGGRLGGWRREMADLGEQIAKELNPIIGQPKKFDQTFNWFGEVSQVRTDGLVEVTLANSDVISVPLSRLTILSDGIESLGDMWGDGGSEGPDYHSAANGEEAGDEAMDIQYGDDMWDPPIVVEGGDWTELDEGEDQPMEGNFKITEPSSSTPPTDNATLPLELPDPHSVASSSTTGDGETPWKCFDILPAAPVDHAFFSTPPSQHTKSFTSRLNKEYKILASSLPESIIVRAYEDRADLLRSMIIGPENTPYEDAPFVIDWMLDPNFPQSPPIAHFLSWTNGNGRVNPNLYEDGKVCLSILGTWAGDRNESWNATRSSLLQALVSIQGLVLVKEPWFCEPAYDKLRGTEEGTVNSRLYSEKAYILSRGFVRRALEIPLGGLTEEIFQIYHGKGKLSNIVQRAQVLIDRSKNGVEEDTGYAIPRLTAGGIIVLQRTMDKLEDYSRNPPTHPQE